MSFFKNIATPLVACGIPVIPLKPKSKEPLFDRWQELASIDPIQIDKWDEEYPNANCASVAQGKIGGIWFFEVDNDTVIPRMEADTGQSLPSTTTVKSSPKRGHIYFKQSLASISMGNLAQGFVKNGDWSARVNNTYCVSPGSIHPKGGTYDLISNEEIVEAPQFLIDWMTSQKIDKKKIIEDDGVSFFTEGRRNDFLTSVGGGLRHAGLDYEGILAGLLRVNELRCRPPLPESEVQTIAASCARYKAGNPLAETVLISGKVAGTTTPVPKTPAIDISSNEEEFLNLIAQPYPVFPEWVMLNTSIFDGFVKPFCDVNSRISYFMFMSAFAIMLNYLGGKVRVAEKNLMPSLYLLMIGKRGVTFKSTSAQDAFAYWELAGLIGHGGLETRNAEGRSTVLSPGSPEGLGKEMTRLRCKNPLLFYDELKMLCDKAGIQSSSMAAALLIWYESKKFQNIVKSQKDSYSFNPGEYCLSLITASTIKNFEANWSKLTIGSSGLADRFSFILQPATLKPIVPYTHVVPLEAARRSRLLVDKAIDQGVYHINNTIPLSQFVTEIKDGNRIEHLAEKFALGFAVDLGYDSIDEDAVERGIALARYIEQVRNYMHLFEAETREGALQQSMMASAKSTRGTVTLRTLENNLHAHKYGTSVWKAALIGLCQYGWAKIDGAGTRGDPKRLTLLVDVLDDEE